MMTKEQFLLVKLAEEATEVAQIALKTAQFGMEEHRIGSTLHNIERTYAELNDLNAIVQMLNDETAFNYQPSQSAMDQKIGKVKMYHAYSVTLGRVEL